MCLFILFLDLMHRAEQGAVQAGSVQILDERDSLRAKVNDMKREKQVLQERLASAMKSVDAMKSDVPVDQQVAELQVRQSWMIAHARTCAWIFMHFLKMKCSSTCVHVKACKHNNKDTAC